MRIYIVCKLNIDNTDNGLILSVDPYITLETAINRAIVIIKQNVNNPDYVTRFTGEAKKYLNNGLSYEDHCGLVRILVKDAI